MYVNDSQVVVTGPFFSGDGLSSMIIMRRNIVRAPGMFPVRAAAPPSLITPIVRDSRGLGRVQQIRWVNIWTPHALLPPTTRPRFRFTTEQRVTLS